MMPKELRNEIHARISAGQSLNKISSETGAPKSTVYEHYKKTRGRKFKLVSVTSVPDDILGEVAGAFAGDGSFTKYAETYHYRVRIHLGPDETEYAHNLYSKLERLFSKKPMMFVPTNCNTIVLAYNSKPVYDWLKKVLSWGEDKTESIRLREGVEKHSKEFLAGFLRGCLDTDGCVHKNGYTTFATISVDLAKQISSALTALGINHRMREIPPRKKTWRKLYLVNIKKRDAIGLLEILRPSNPKRAYRMRPAGIEPALPPWQGGIMPLDHGRTVCAVR